MATFGEIGDNSGKVNQKEGKHRRERQKKKQQHETRLVEDGGWVGLGA